MSEQDGGSRTQIDDDLLPEVRALVKDLDVAAGVKGLDE